MENFKLEGEYIKLDSLLKAACVVGSGGEAKMRILDGEFSVNGETELRRGRKLRKGDNITAEGVNITVI